MNQQTLSTIERTAKSSKAGTVHFGEVIAALSTVGVERYHADYQANTTTYYLPNGETHAMTLEPPEVPVAEAFDVAAVQAAIRGAQQGDVKYPQFLRLSRAAGCVGYIVWITGRHVTYFGRLGQTHVERFPD